MKKKIIAIMMALTMVAGMTVTSYAAEQSVSYTWVQGVDGVLKVTDSSGNVVTNTWYKDTDGTYYYLGQDGSKQTGLIEKEGHYYYLDASGKMVVTDGVYEGVNLIINKDASSATYGEILSGVEGMLNAVSESAGGVQQQTQEQIKVQDNQKAIDKFANMDNQEAVNGLAYLTPEEEELNQAFANFDKNRD